MATTNPLAYNTGPTISGTDQVGSLAIGTTPQEYSANIGGVPWWMSPDEDLGFVIAHPVPSNTQHTPIPGTFASLGFNRTKDFTDESFINLAQYVSNKYSTPQTFSSATQASIWLTTNGFWNTYASLGNMIMNWDVQNASSYPGAGTTIFDLAGHSNGTLYNGVTYRSGITNYLLNDWSTSSSYMMNNSDLNSFLNPPNTGSDISIFTWVYPLTNNGVIISEQGTPNPPDQNWYDSQIELVSGVLYFRVWGISPVISSIDLVYNDWNYVGLTYNSSNQTLSGWVNGQFAGSQTGVRQTPYNDGGGRAQYYTFGFPCATNFGSNTGLDSRFGGLEVYNYGLPSNTVRANYLSSRINYTRGLIMDLDATNSFSYGGAGSTWYDLTAYSNDGSLVNAVYSGITGGTMVFNGTNAYVSVGQPLSTGTDYSISAWVYANDLTGARNIVSSFNSPFWCSNGILYAGTGGNYLIVTNGTSLSTNTWYFVTMTYSQSNHRMSLYVNGSLVNNNNSVSETYTAENTFIGSHYNGVNVSFWDGYISQVYMYANEQTSSEVLHLYNKTKSLYQNSFTITSSRIYNIGAFGGIFSGVTVDGYTLLDNQSNQLWGTYYSNIAGDDTDILNAFANASEPTTNGTGYIWNVQWGPGSTYSTLAKVGYYAPGKNLYMIAVDPSDPNWQNSGNVQGTALLGTFNLPATFTVYVPPTQKGGWC